jgi:beta-phosphoglucomutase
MHILQGVLWDLDGVLADTSELHYQSWVQALDEFGMEITREFFQSHFGQNNHLTLSHLLGDKANPEFVDKISDLKEVYFRLLIRGQTQLFPGVKLWLETFSQSGVKMAIASSAPQENIEALVDQLAIRSYFDALVTGHSLPPKPQPAVFLLAAERIGIPPAGCVVIEDSIAGVEAARRAGMKCLAVTTSHPAEALQQANWVIERLDRLPPEQLIQLFSTDGKNPSSDQSNQGLPA